MIYGIPVIGWIIGLLFAIFMAIPMYFLWNYVAPIYCYWLPPVYLKIGFWDMVWLFMTISILKAVLIPRALVSAEATSKK